MLLSLKGCWMATIKTSEHHGISPKNDGKHSNMGFSIEVTSTWSSGSWKTLWKVATKCAMEGSSHLARSSTRDKVFSNMTANYNEKTVTLVTYNWWFFAHCSKLPNHSPSIFSSRWRFTKAYSLKGSSATHRNSDETFSGQHLLLRFIEVITPIFWKMSNFAIHPLCRQGVR